MENIWIECYQITLKTKKAYKQRLEELKTWDSMPGKHSEWLKKVAALEFLLA